MVASPSGRGTVGGMSGRRRRGLVIAGVWGVAIVVMLAVIKAGTHDVGSAPPASPPNVVVAAVPQVRLESPQQTAAVDDGGGDVIASPATRSAAAGDGAINRPAPGRVSQNNQPSACDGSSATTCLQCLYGDGSEGCVWCASERRCVNAAANHSGCIDAEDRSCPAVLHTPIPQTIRVIHVAIRKGGPEALVQMHLALNREGFKTTLDTRRSKKQKGGPVVPFFTEMYAAEFAKAPPLRWEGNYDSWLASAAEGDVMMSTETWACKNEWAKELASGARQMQWHLTVWPKKPRHGCTISAHTNHIAQEYMQTPRRAVLFPYISPHIVRLAKEKAGSDGGAALRSRKTDLVMYDGDVKLNDVDVKPPGARWSVRNATGFTPQDLYAKYAEAKVGIDLVLPGAERFIYEASLFDVCIIVDNVANGADTSDVPLPARFRVQPGNLSAMHERIRECVEHYDGAIAEQRALKEHTMRQRDTFHRHVRRYFSNSVHVVTYFPTTESAEWHFAAFVLHTLIAVPFATIEIRHAPRVVFPSTALKTLRDASWLAAVIFTEVPEPTTKAWLPSTNPKRVALVMFVPHTTVLLAGDVVHAASSALALVRKTATVVVADRSLQFAVFAASDLATMSARRLLDGSADLASLPAFRASSDVVTRVCIGGAAGAEIAGEHCDGAATSASLERLSKRLGRGEPLATKWGSASIGETIRQAGTARQAFLCSHPLYAAMMSGVCA